MTLDYCCDPDDQDRRCHGDYMPTLYPVRCRRAFEAEEGPTVMDLDGWCSTPARSLRAKCKPNPHRPHPLQDVLDRLAR